jgi:predicted TPR repeat methyltransferase
MTVNQPFTFDEYEDDSDPFGYENNPEDNKRLAILIDLIPTSKFSRVLDLGCGNGFITSNILNADEVIGIDVSPKAVDLANSRFKIQGKINHVALKRNILTEKVDDIGKFDLIIATGVFYTHYLGFNHKLIEKKCNYLLNKMGFLISTHIKEMPNVIPSQNFIVIDRLIYDYKNYTHEILVQRKIR